MALTGFVWLWVIWKLGNSISSVKIRKNLKIQDDTVISNRFQAKIFLTDFKNRLWNIPTFQENIDSWKWLGARVVKSGLERSVAF